MFEPLSALGEEELDKATGLPRYIRRLTDKILSAYNHACAAGEAEVADHLRSALTVLQTSAQVTSNKRAGTDLLDHANLWVAFIGARDRYRTVREHSGREGPDFEDALTAMKAAYQRWSLA